MKTPTKNKVKEKLAPLFFIGPHLIFFIVFVVFPFFFGIIISFTKWDMMGTPEFVGFDNYITLFTKDNVFSTSFLDGLKATSIYTVFMVPLLISVPLLFAVLLLAVKNQKLRGVFQAILYASSILSVATVVLTWDLIQQ